MSNTITPTVFYRTLNLEGLHNMKKLILSVFIFTFGFATATHAQQVNTLLTKHLPEAPGKEIEVITVNYAPGAVDAIHRHDAHAVVYVLDGEVEMQFAEARFAAWSRAGILRIT